jgi:hypothetical protein
MPTITISLPIVDGFDYVIQQGMRQQLVNELGFFISITEVHTIIEGAIIGASSGLNRDSRAIVFVLADSLEGKTHVLEQRSRYLLALRQKKWRKNKRLENGIEGLAAAEGEQSLLDALAGKLFHHHDGPGGSEADSQSRRIRLGLARLCGAAQLGQ